MAGGAENSGRPCAADRLGLAFQIQDDILDVVGDEATWAAIGSDARSDKTTLCGTQRSGDRRTGGGVDRPGGGGPAPFGRGESLRGLAQSLAGREK